MPLGSTIMLLRPPALAGPGGMPLIGTFPAPAWPAIRANDAAGVARRRSARAIFAELFDIMDSVVLQSDRSDVVHDDRVSLSPSSYSINCRNAVSRQLSEPAAASLMTIYMVSRVPKCD